MKFPNFETQNQIVWRKTEEKLTAQESRRNEAAQAAKKDTTSLEEMVIEDSEGGPATSLLSKYWVMGRRRAAQPIGKRQSYEKPKNNLLKEETGRHPEYIPEPFFGT